MLFPNRRTSTNLLKHYDLMEKNLFDLSGKCALVTGASGGIGSAIARGLHAQGAELVLSGTRQRALEKMVSELKDRVRILKADLNDLDSIHALTKSIENDVEGGIDILVNNAGITRDSLLLRMKDDDWQQVLSINLTATFHLTRILLRGMIKRRWGRVIGISSIVGATGNAGQTNYAAAKAGMVGFSKALAYEVANRGITVNVVAPGLVETGMLDSLSKEHSSKLLSNIPAGRFGSPDEIAAAVIYLASREAAYVNGATLHVNGGMAMI